MPLTEAVAGGLRCPLRPGPSGGRTANQIEASLFGALNETEADLVWPLARREVNRAGRASAASPERLPRRADPGLGRVYCGGVVSFIALLIALPLTGLLVRRWSAILLPLIAWPMYYIGRNEGWWGCCGTGDGWEALAVMLTVLGVTTTAAAILLGQTFASRFAGPFRPR